MSILKGSMLIHFNVEKLHMSRLFRTFASRKMIVNSLKHRKFHVEHANFDRMRHGHFQQAGREHNTAISNKP